MGGKSAPAAPDYSGIAAALQGESQSAAKTAADQLAWAKDQYAQTSGTAKDMYSQYMNYLNKQTDLSNQQTQQSINTQNQVVQDALARAKINDANAAADRQNYLDTYRPLEQKQAQDALTFASPEREAQQRARVAAQQAQAFDAQRTAAQNQLESYGVDPSSTRYAALDNTYRAQRAAAQAGAMSQSDQSVEAQQRALQADAINVGRGLASSVAGTYGTALASGSQASGAASSAAAAQNQAAATGISGYGTANSLLGGQTAAAGTYGNLMGTGPQWAGLGQNALTSWGNTLNMGYQNQLSGWQAQQQASTGLGSILGFASSIPGVQTGGAIPDGAPPPVAAPNPNVVPVQASPSRGAIPDDVNARVEPGEYVVPKDVVRWKGEEFFQKAIDQSRKAKAEATAKPQMKPPLNAPTSFVSRGAAAGMQPPGAGAIPA